jgi:hypothetical protein
VRRKRQTWPARAAKKRKCSILCAGRRVRRSRRL